MAITAGDITFSSSSIQAWAPDIWAPELIEAVQFYIVIAGLFDDKSAMMTEGHTLHLPQVHNLAAQAKTAGTEFTTSNLEKIDETTNAQTFSVATQYACAFCVEDLGEIQSRYAVREEYTKRAGYALARQLDVDAAGQIDNPTGIGVGGSVPSDTILRQAWQTLTDNAAPTEDRYYVCAPATYAGLLGLDKFVNADYVKQGEFGQGVREANVGSIYGVGVYISQLTTGTAPTSNGGFWQKQHYFKVVQRPATPHLEYRALSIGWTVVIDTIYGVFERLEPNEGASLTTMATLWATNVLSVK